MMNEWTFTFCKIVLAPLWIWTCDGIHKDTNSKCKVQQ